MSLNRTIRVDIEATGAVSGSRTAVNALQEVDNQARRTGGGFDVLQAGGGKAAESLASIGVAAAGIITVLSAAAAGVVGNFLGVAAGFEKMNVSLKTVTGSAESAEQAMSWITTFTATTPFQLEEVAQGFRKLTAYGIDAASALPLLGDAASAMGKDLNSAVEMFADAATGEFERLKEFGVRASQEGDNVTFSWQENGQQMTATTAKTQAAITAELGKIFDRFQGAMLAQSTTWEGMTSNMADSWTLWKKGVMDEGPFEFLKLTMGDVVETFQTETGKMQLKEWASGTADAILNTFEVASYAIQALAFPISGIKGAFSGLKLGIVEIEELALDMYMGLYDFLPSTVSLTSEQIKAMRMTIAQTRAEANSGLEAVGTSTEYINNMFKEMRQNIEKARSASSTVTASVTPASSPTGGAQQSTSSKEAKAREQAHKKMIEDGQNAATVLDKYWTDYEDARVKAITGQVEARGEAKAEEIAIVEDTVNWMSYAAKAMEDTVSGAFQNMGDAIVDFAMTGKMSFSDFADSVVKDMMRIMVQQQIVGPLAGATGDFLSSLFAAPSSAAGSASGGFNYAGEMSSFFSRNAKGGAYNSPSLSAYSNGVYDSPRLFAFAQGGVFAEEGPEAIMPLKKGPDGILGVRASGGGVSIVVNNNASNTQATATAKDDGQGGKSIEIIIDEMVAGNMARHGSASDRSMRRNYAVRQNLARR